MDELFQVLSNFNFWTSVVSALIGCVVYFRFNQENKYFVTYIVIGSVIELIAKSFAIQGKNNLIFFHINTLIEFSILTLFFAHIFTAKKDILVKWVLVPGTLLIIFNTLFVQKVDSYNSIALTAVSIYLIGLCLYFFYKIIDQDDSIEERTFTKYAVCSIFVLHSISIMVLFFGNYLNEIKHENDLYIWITRASIILIVKIMILYQLSKIAVGFLYKKVLQ